MKQGTAEILQQILQQDRWVSTGQINSKKATPHDAAAGGSRRRQAAADLKVARWQATLRMARTSPWMRTASSGLVCCGRMNHLQQGGQGGTGGTVAAVPLRQQQSITSSSKGGTAAARYLQQCLAPRRPSPRRVGSRGDGG